MHSLEESYRKQIQSEREKKQVLERALELEKRTHKEVMGSIMEEKGE